MSKMLACLVVFLAVCGSVRAATPGLAEKCSNQFQKVAMCLSYATGKADTPTKECCESVKGIRESTPECLCYVIQQANSGSDEIKKMGLQIDKLIQLPTACDLKNATASNCPKLLGIPAGSPEAAIFTNNATSTTPAATGQTPPTSAKDSSGISRLAPQSAALMAIAVAIFFFFAFPAVGSINL